MILITTRAADVADWIEANCAAPSRYTIAKPWHDDITAPGSLIVAIDNPQELSLILSPTDAMLFAIHYAGCFIEHPDKGRWFDDTPLNRAILDLRANGPRYV